ERDAERVGADLREHGLDALAHRGAARVDGRGAAAGELDTGVLPARDAALLDEEGEAEPAPAAVPGPLVPPAPEPVPVEAPARLLEQQGVVAAVVDDGVPVRVRPARVRHPRRRDEVAAPQLDRVEPEPVRSDVDQPLAGEVRLVAAGRPVRARGRLARDDVADLAPV